MISMPVAPLLRETQTSSNRARSPTCPRRPDLAIGCWILDAGFLDTGFWILGPQSSLARHSLARRRLSSETARRNSLHRNDRLSSEKRRSISKRKDLDAKASHFSISLCQPAQCACRPALFNRHRAGNSQFLVCGTESFGGISDCSAVEWNICQSGVDDFGTLLSHCHAARYWQSPDRRRHQSCHRRFWNNKERGAVRSCDWNFYSSRGHDHRSGFA